MFEAENNPDCINLRERISKCSEAHGKIVEEIKTWVENSSGNEDTWKQTKKPEEMAAINETFSELLKLRTELSSSMCVDFLKTWKGINNPPDTNEILQTKFTNITKMFYYFEWLENKENERKLRTYGT